MNDLHQKVAVITGASSGIGRATSLLLAREGARLALVDIDDTGLARVKKEIQEITSPADVRTFHVDVADRDQMQTLVKDVISAFRDVHILINNAGINVTAPFPTHSLDDFDRVLSVNLHGVIYGCHFFLPHLLRAPKAHIVNISSIFGIVAVAEQSAYSTSKFAVRGFTETLHEELKDSHIGVSIVHPGCINTNIVKTARIADPIKARDVIDYFERKGASPNLVALRILGAIKTGKHRVLVTPESHLFDLLRRLAPQRGNRLANALLDRFIGVL